MIKQKIEKTRLFKSLMSQEGDSEIEMPLGEGRVEKHLIKITISKYKNTLMLCFVIVTEAPID